jgi:hypothetical protein
MKISLYIEFFSMHLIFKFLIWWCSIFILTLIWHTFWIHILDYYICMTNLVLSFWKFIMNTLLKKNSIHIFFNIILAKVYYNMDNLLQGCMRMWMDGKYFRFTHMWIIFIILFFICIGLERDLKLEFEQILSSFDFKRNLQCSPKIGFLHL